MGKLRLEKELADKVELAEEKRAALADAEANKVDVEKHAEEIKPECDFIQQNLALRKANHAAETEALTKVIAFIKSTPAYKGYELKREQASLGECQDVCLQNSLEHVSCKACLAKVEVEGYCAGHPGTAGC
eukprot:NODE_7720_length_424_cov_251.685637.p1 GENE.NODE_7720_length_424_cov_251.685637~~NODE_7720_length_424_cov_251.685637.p1  ORF type:complete len:131 (+),score=63.12 NODE_7720_length_424_cov_251.685637:3-395(+)